jgi:hypothetical protein
MVSVIAALLFLIFGFGHPSREPLDPAKGVQLHSRLPCNGDSAPEDLLRTQTTFSSGGAAREFLINRYEVDKCGVETMLQCWHKERIAWRRVWSADSVSSPDKATAQAPAKALVPIGSCYEWGRTDPAQYVLSGWYNQGTEAKPNWLQVPVKQVSSQPETYEFTDPMGGTAHLEITR